MSTPESKLEVDIAKVKTFWADYRLYFVAAGCLLVGGIIGHAI